MASNPTDTVRSEIRSDYVPADDYISPAIHKAEMEHVWPRTWLVACREEDIAEPGDFVTFEFGHESILIVRGKDGHPHAYHNVCPHRGRRLRAPAESGGNLGPAIYCRYHGWRWELDGNPQFIPAQENWQGCPRFTDQDLALAQVSIGSWGGWLWINFEKDPAPLAEYLDPVPEYLDPFAFQDMRTRWHYAVKVPANWKTALEAFCEAYHAPATHPQTASYDRDYGTGFSATSTHGLHGRMALGSPFERSAPGKIDFTAVLERSIMAMVEQYEAMYFEPSIAAMERVKEELRADASFEQVFGLHWVYTREEAERRGMRWPDDLTPEAVAKAGFDWLVFPNSIFLMTVDGLVLYRAWPDGDDPNSCIWDIRCLARAAPGDKPACERRYFASPEAFEGANYLLEQDLSNILEVQAGMRSSGFAGARTNPVQELTVSHLHRMIHRYIDERS